MGKQVSTAMIAAVGDSLNASSLFTCLLSWQQRECKAKEGFFQLKFVAEVCCRPHLTAVGAVRGAEVADGFDMEPFSQF